MLKLKFAAARGEEEEEEEEELVLFCIEIPFLGPVKLLES